jgi:hypothetical protein
MNLIARVMVLVLTLPLAASRFAGAQDAGTEKPLSEQGYIGLALRDIPDGHTVASWIFPGPLNGQGLEAPDVDLARPDVIVSVNGEAMNAEQFKEFIRSSAPGTQVVIEYRRANNRGGGIPDAIDAEDEVRRIEVTLESRDEWTGTIGRGRPSDWPDAFTEEQILEAERYNAGLVDVYAGPWLVDPGSDENIFGAALTEHNLKEPLEKLLDVFHEWIDRDEDYNLLRRVQAGFDNPFCLPELAKVIATRSVAPFPLDVPELKYEATHEPISFATEIMLASLDSEGVGGMITGPGPASASAEVARELLDALRWTDQVWMRDALRSVPRDEQFARRCVEFLRVPKHSFYISGPDSKSHIGVIRQSMAVDWDSLGNALLAFNEDSAEGLMDGAPGTMPGLEELNGLEPITLPEELNGSVGGPILAADFDEKVGWLVIGTDAANRYDMAKIAAVIEPGGNDEYYATDLRLGTRVIIDFAGDDHYTGTPEQGPGGALLGVSFIDDRAGDDVYEGELLACGAAMYGVSLLLDRAGNDIYRGSEWSLGAAVYGAGMIIDLGGGADQYLGDFLCEGVGGPRGFGCIVDDNGRDLYRANGPTPSAYGTPAVYQSFSQGMGFGYRNYAAGGIGMISDLGGDDRYEAGEFAQGGAYYYGLGILHDASGRDLYYGNRYGQGFGVHQAVGILVDDAGDDTYWSMTAASQGAAWDIGVGLLLDRAGNDTYQCDGLGQGGASMQAIAMLIDLAGRDRYVAGGGATQGQSGGNSYHYHETGAFSFSLLLDLGGEEDYYSRGRANNAVTETGSFNEKDPKNSGLHGLVIDE